MWKRFTEIVCETWTGAIVFSLVVWFIIGALFCLAITGQSPPVTVITPGGVVSTE